MGKNLLGEPANYPQDYSPDVLFGIARQESRVASGIDGQLPFHGVDFWTAWELTWLDLNGRPVVATATIRVPAESTSMVESKSLKLYLNSFAMSSYASPGSVQDCIAADLAVVVGAEVTVSVTPASTSDRGTIDVLPGLCIDNAQSDFSATGVDSGLLSCTDDTVSEALHSHLLRSNCPVTNQPDMASILIRYTGPQIAHASLLQYLVSFRQHNDFHEACVERIFTDLKRECRPERLSVYACYTRRGGIDINPFRSDFEDLADNLRLWRQ